MNLIYILACNFSFVKIKIRNAVEDDLLDTWYKDISTRQMSGNTDLSILISINLGFTNL